MGLVCSGRFPSLELLLLVRILLAGPDDKLKLACLVRVGVALSEDFAKCREWGQATS
jgi:hypothetical protein